MAVFTTITSEELQAWLLPLACGKLIGFEGISSGIENTNYFVNTSKGKYVLTIFEKLTSKELPFYLGLMQHLAGKGLPVPGPIATAEGELFRNLKGKPATLVNCLGGRSVIKTNAKHCAAIGAFSAKAHLAAADYAGNLSNPRNLRWVMSAAEELKHHLPSGELTLLQDEIAHQQKVSESDLYAELERGAVHADLFRDNALMLDDNLGGVIDFYFAGVDTFLFDTAVTVNDWCINQETGELISVNTESFLNAYAKHRSFSKAEKALWPDLLRAAALRFWTSRLHDYFMPRAAEMLSVKDPKHFERVLLARRSVLAPTLP